MFTDSHDKMILHLVCMRARDQHEKITSYVENSGTEYKRDGHNDALQGQKDKRGATVETMFIKQKKT